MDDRDTYSKDEPDVALYLHCSIGIFWILFSRTTTHEAYADSLLRQPQRTNYIMTLSIVRNPWRTF
jgi:hypothetical protein